jgi:hypothetical protein
VALNWLCVDVDAELLLMAASSRGGHRVREGQVGRAWPFHGELVVQV